MQRAIKLLSVGLVPNPELRRDTNRGPPISPVVRFSKRTDPNAPVARGGRQHLESHGHRRNRPGVVVRKHCGARADQRPTSSGAGGQPTGARADAITSGPHKAT